MIVLLTTRKKPRAGDALAELGTIRAFRAPTPPTRPPAQPDGGPNTTRPFRPDPEWAYRRLRALDRIIAEGSVTAIVCSDAKAHAFALEAAEQHPGTAVLPDPAIAARILGELRERGTVPTREAVHDLLDPLRPTLPPVPRYLFDRDRRAPMVVSLVQNSVTGDSRVQKVAESLARAGYQSVLLAANPPDRPEGDWFLLGNAAVLRLPVAKDGYQAQKDSPPGPLIARLFGYPDSAADRAAWDRHLRELDLLAQDRDPSLPTRVAGRVVEWRSWLYRRNRRSFGNLEHRRGVHERRAARLSSARSLRDPESAYPLIADMERVFAPALEALKPHAIHVHDPMFLGIAARARRHLERLGCDAQLVFDAHEWTPGVQREHAYHAAVLTRLERRFLVEAAATITVSDQIADRMQTEFGLADRPTVVENAPWSVMDHDYADVRTDAGVPPDVPLLVYVGGIAERRGVDDVIGALEHLPDAHVVLLSPSGTRLRQLRQRARELGVLPRMHHLEYVPAEKVTSYIRTADIGVVPLRPLLNSSLGVPTKFREYLLAGLPIVATDLGATSQAVRATGVGELCGHSNPQSLAAAVRKILADRDRYTAAITPELAAANSWENESRNLIGVYERLVGAPPAPTRGSRVLIGATNSAGQAFEWARALRAAGIEARSVELRMPENSFTHRVDLSLPRPALGTLDRRVQLLLELVSRSDTVVIESGRPIAAPEPGEVDARRQGFREARALRDSGRNVGLLFHGSDIRRPDVHRRTHRWSPFQDARAAALTAELRKRTTVVHEELASWDGPVMVSTPDLIHATPGAVWTPVVVDLDLFPRMERNATDRSDPPVVVHMPSRSILKGSHLVDPVLRDLSREGLIRYRRIERVPHESVPEVLSECDIFVDQLGMGIFGVAPLEAMATGAAVITDPGPEALEVYGEEVPVVAVNPETLEQAVRDLAADYEKRQQLAKAGRDFVVRNHDGRRSAAAFITALGL